MNSVPAVTASAFQQSLCKTAVPTLAALDSVPAATALNRVLAVAVQDSVPAVTALNSVLARI